MTAGRYVPPSGAGVGGAQEITLTLALPPDQACEQVVAGLLRRRHFRLKKLSGPTAQLALGGAPGVVLGPLSPFLGYAQERFGLPVGHLGLLWERVDVRAEPGSDPQVSTVCLRPTSLTRTEVNLVLADDLEPVAAALAASGHLVAVGSWEKIDQQAVRMSEREEKKSRRMEGR